MPVSGIIAWLYPNWAALINGLEEEGRKPMKEMGSEQQLANGQLHRTRDARDEIEREYKAIAEQLLHLEAQLDTLSVALYKTRVRLSGATP